MPEQQQQGQIRHCQKSAEQVEQRQGTAAQAVHGRGHHGGFRRKAECAGEQIGGHQIEERVADKNQVECAKKWEDEKQQVHGMKHGIVRIGEIRLPAVPVNVPQRPFPFGGEIEQHLLLRNEIVEQIAEKEGFVEKKRAKKEEHARQDEQPEFFFAQNGGDAGRGQVLLAYWRSNRNFTSHFK